MIASTFNTSSDDSFDNNARSVDLFGELVHGCRWVLVRVRVDVTLSTAVRTGLHA